MNYEIKGTPFPVAICSLNPEESLKCEKGAMSWMSCNMEMQTNAGGGLGKMFSRVVSGESAFQNVYTAKDGNGMIAFASSFPGEILPIQITSSKSIVAQKTAFLASEMGVEVSVFFQKKLGAGFFGGEGFIMQRLSGNGMAFLEIDGSTVEYDLKAGESMLVDTGYLAAMDETCSITIEKIKGLGNIMFGGESLFNTRILGPGHVWLQTMPISNVAGSIIPFLPNNKN